MAKSDTRSVLAIGAVDVTPLAASARRAGYDVYAVDYYGDQDLEHSCVATLSFMKQGREEPCPGVFSNFIPEALLQLAKNLRRNYEIERSLLSSGLDDWPDALVTLDDLVPILGNTPEAFLKVRDKSKFFLELERLGVAYPKTVIVRNLAEAKSVSKDLGFPLVLKPKEGFGGVSMRKASSLEELEGAFKSIHLRASGILLQEYVLGTHASASVMSVPGKAMTLAVSEQLLGRPEVGQREPFGYCGNIVPLSAPTQIMDKCRDVAERVVSHFGLIGTNGVDLVVSKEGTPHVIEVNPRFQGTIECVERVLGLNLVETHVKACAERKLPAISERATRSCMRLVLFAKQRSVPPDLSAIKECRDVPAPGVVVREGKPLCSMLIENRDRRTMLKKAKQICRLIYSSLSSASSEGCI
jgi:hypothetical protein